MQAIKKQIKERIVFSKGGNLRFIGHLDFLRVFLQTIRRANLPVAYSQGFNPHILISFALPLPLGMYSKFDYVDITLNEECPNMVELLNIHAPNGLIIHKTSPVTDKGAASVVTVADYRVEIPHKLQRYEFEYKPLLFSPLVITPYMNLVGERPSPIGKKLKEIMDSKEIITTKKTKSGLKNVDIRPDIKSIHDVSFALAHGIAFTRFVDMRLYAGSARFLNPLTVMGQILDDVSPSTVNIERVNMYKPSETEIGEWVEL